MSEQAPRAVIDSLEFARDGLALRGSLEIGAFDRLRESLFDCGGRIDFEIQGGHDSLRRPVLRLQVRGALRLRCQRCLGSLEYPLLLDRTLLLQTLQDPLADTADDDEDESIDPDPGMDVALLVEDELILSLPYAPRHADGECTTECGTGTRTGFDTPLAGLAGLKRNTN